MFKDFFQGFGEELHGKHLYNTLSQDHKIEELYFFKKDYKENAHLLNFGKNAFESGHEWELEFVNKCLKIFEFDKKLKIEPIVQNQENIGFSYYLTNGSELVALHEEGFGVRKLVNTLVFLADKHSLSNQSYIIEEPESNLHPAFQSKLADNILS